MFDRIDDLPSDVQALSPDAAQLWMNTYNRVFKQTEDSFASTLAAWGAIDKRNFRTVKAVDDGKTVAGWAMMFTDEDHLDLHDTFFSHLSKLFLEYYPQAPLWYEHGFDIDYSIEPIGQRRRDMVGVYGHGIYMGHNLHTDHHLWARTHQEVVDGEHSYSSDSIGHYVDEGFNWINGELRAWPFAGCSLTKRPAEPGLGKVALKSFADQLQTLFENRPRKSHPTPGRDYRESAGGAKGGHATGDDDGRETRNPTSENKGNGNMDPELLANLAALLGVEATVETLVPALEDLIGMLQTEPEEGQAETLEQLRSAIKSAADLADDADDSALVDAVQDVIDMLTAGDDDDNEPDYQPLAEAFRAAREHREEQNKVPFMHKSSRWDKGIKHNKGNARKPGLMDVIGAASQVGGGSVKFDMPAFGARISPYQAMKAMDITTGENGGFVLNREQSDDILEALYAQLVLDRLGVESVPMVGIESVTWNRFDSGAQAYWGGAGQITPDAQGKVKGAVTLQLKEIVAVSIQQNRLLRHSSQRVEQMIQDDMIKKMGLKMDLAAFYGSGGVPADGGSTGAEPLGLKNTTDVTQTSLASKVATPDNLIEAEGRIEDANVEYGASMAWVTHGKARRQFKKLKDADGDPLYEESWNDVRVREMTLNGWPMHTTTQIPLTVASSIETTDIFLGEWSHMLIGQGEEFEVVVDTSNRVLQRETVIQIVSMVDFGVAYKEAFEILTLAKTN